MSKRKNKKVDQVEPIVDVEEIETIDAVDRVDTVDTVDVVGQDDTFADFIAQEEAPTPEKKRKPLTRFRLPKHLKA